MFKTSCLYEANYNAAEDIIVNQGGSYSAKTYSILQALLTYAVRSKYVITVTAESIPNLKKGALRQAIEIVNSSPILKSCLKDYNKTDRIFTFDTGTIMEFTSYQTPQDAHGGKRDFLFVNEANAISSDIFDQLELRTDVRTFIDYNPSAEFWAHEQLIGKENVKLIISDHRHNPFIKQKTRNKLEALKLKDEELWKVYARGLTGKIEGLVFRNFEIVKDVPLGAELIGCGMDFGFTNDPTPFVKCFRWEDCLVVDELMYNTGMTSGDIINALKGFGISRQMGIVADSADPKTIREIELGGFTIEGAEKGPDSIIGGINKMKDFKKILITQGSTNTIKEFRNYKWQTDSTGKTINKPVDFFNHSIDAIRYVILNKVNKGSGKYSFI